MTSTTTITYVGVDDEEVATFDAACDRMLAEDNRIERETEAGNRRLRQLAIEFGGSPLESFLGYPACHERGERLYGTLAATGKSILPGSCIRGSVFEVEPHLTVDRYVAEVRWDFGTVYATFATKDQVRDYLDAMRLNSPAAEFGLYSRRRPGAVPVHVVNNAAFWQGQPRRRAPIYLRA